MYKIPIATDGLLKGERSQILKYSLIKKEANIPEATDEVLILDCAC